MTLILYQGREMSVLLQPGTEMIVKGYVQDAPKLRKDNEWAMLEPCEKFLKRDCALVAKALSRTGQFQFYLWVSVC
jgi:hypothetical protein